MPSRYLSTPTVRSIQSTLALARATIRSADLDGDGRLSRAELKAAQQELKPTRVGDARSVLLRSAWAPREGKEFARVATMERALDRFEATLMRADLNDNGRIPETELQKPKDSGIGNQAIYEASVLWGASR
jgi:EF hand